MNGNTMNIIFAAVAGLLGGFLLGVWLGTVAMKDYVRMANERAAKKDTSSSSEGRRRR